jgi:pimeloyl-ACP methyl ester carboxylesterase
LEVWDGVFAALDPALSAFAYSRPGYNGSGALADDARTSEEAAALLRAVLAGAGVAPRYVLVGHSLGGLYIAKYAANYADEVAGLVFVDGRPPGFRALCEEHGVAFCAESAPMPPNWPGYIRAEGEGIRPSEDVAPAADQIRHVPATIVTSTSVWPGEDGDVGFALWLEAQRGFADAFEDSRFVRAEGSGHYVQRADPALVVREIEALVARLGSD